MNSCMKLSGTLLRSRPVTMFSISCLVLGLFKYFIFWWNNLQYGTFIFIENALFIFSSLLAHFWANVPLDSFQSVPLFTPSSLYVNIFFFINKVFIFIQRTNYLIYLLILFFNLFQYTSVYFYMYYSTFLLFNYFMHLSFLLFLLSYKFMFLY